MIAINRGGPKNIITNMVDGILVESENPEMFAQAIALLANDPELRGRMAQLAIEKVRKKFTLEKHAVLTETFLLQAIAQVNRGAPFLQKTYSA